MLRLINGNVIYNNSVNLGPVEGLVNTGEGFVIALPDRSLIFIPEEDCTDAEREVFKAYHDYYKDTGGIKPVIPLLDDLKAAKIAEIREKCNKTITKGFTSSVKGGVEKCYGLDYEDQINIEALKNAILQGSIDDGNLEYYAKGEKCEIWSNEEFLAFYAEAMNYKTSNIKRSKELIDLVKNATTEEEILAIEW